MRSARRTRTWRRRWWVRSISRTAGRFSAAHSAGSRNSPVIATNTLQNIEHRARIILLLDVRQLLEVRAKEGRLPIWLPEIGLVHIRTTSRSDCHNLGHENLGHLLLVSLHGGPWCRGVPVGDELQLGDRVPPDREDSVVWCARSLLVVCGATSKKNTIGGKVIVDLDKLSSVVLQDTTWDQASTELVAVDLVGTTWKWTHVLVVVITVGQFAVSDWWRNAEFLQGSSKGCDNNVLDVGCGGVPDGDRLDNEELSVLEEDNHSTLVDHSRHEFMELGSCSSELLRGGRAGKQLHSGTSDLSALVGTDSQRGYNTVGTATSTTESPVKVRILSRRGSEDLSIGGDNLTSLVSILRRYTIDW